MKFNDVCYELQRVNFRIQRSCDRIESLYIKATKTSGGGGMGGGSGGGVNHGKIEYYATEIAYEKDKLQEYEMKKKELTEQLEMILSNIDKPDVKEAIIRKYVNGESWVRIAIKLEQPSADSIRIKCDRYLRKIII